MKMIKSTLSIGCITILILSQTVFFMSDLSFASTEKPGETFTVRVGYFGDDTDYRVKSKFSESRMNALPQQTNYYANITRVGTIMTTVARGPTLKSIIDSAGIDVGSVRMIHARTSDASGNANNWFMEFPADKYIGNSLYYYPNLVEKWERTGDGSGIPGIGALKEGRKVDTIMAIKSYSTKSVSEAKTLTPEMMNTNDSYRLCAGQKPLKEGIETFDVSSNESAKWILGIDITLWGSPKDARGISLHLNDRDLKVGSTKRIKAVIIGQDLFEDMVEKELKWRSSDKSIATVDKKGNVQVKKKGTVTITAETKNGIKNSIVINGTDGSSAKDKDVMNVITGNDGNGENDYLKGNTIKLRNIKAIEVSIGDAIAGTTDDARSDMAEDAVELAKEDVNPRYMLYAGLVALVIFIAGALIRAKRFFREV